MAAASAPHRLGSTSAYLGAHTGHASPGVDIVRIAASPPAPLAAAVDDRLDRLDALAAVAHRAHGLASSSGRTLPSPYSSTSAARSASGSGMARAASSERFVVTLKLRTLSVIESAFAFAAAASVFAFSTQCGHAVPLVDRTSAQHSRQKSFSHPSQCLKQSAMLLAHRSQTSR